MASPFNIFDFSALGGASSIAKPPLQTPGVTGGGVMPPTTSGQPALERPQVLPTQPVKSTQPQIGNLDNEKIKRFIDHGKSIGKSKEDIMTAYQKGIQSGAFNKMEAPKPEESFLGGAFSKTLEGAKKGISRIGEAGEGLATGKYNMAEAAIRGGAGALETAFSPISGVLGQGIQEGIEELSPETKQVVGEFASPKIQAAKDWYNSQTPEQKRNLDNIGVSLEVLANFVGAKAVQKGGQQIVKGAEKTGEVFGNTGEKIINKTGTIGEAIETKGKNFRNAVAGLDEKEVSALKNTPTSEWEGIVKQAKQAKDNDYVQTPYNEGARKANEAMKTLEDNLEMSQTKRMEEIKNSGVTSIDTTKVRQDIVSDLEKTFNVTGITTKGGKVQYKTTPGRSSLLDEANPKDIEAIRLLESATKTKTPLEMMDNIKKMQNLIYDSNILNRTSKDMANLVKRSIGKLNSAFKEQVGGNYAKILEDMSTDIQLKKQLDKVFKASSGEEVLNRGELAMKRLANGTTTSAEARQLALLIKEKTGIDLIKEARLRQLAMDMVGDKRGATLFGAIEKGPKGMLEYGLGKIKDLSPLSKEKTALARTQKILPNKSKNGTTSGNNNTAPNTTNKPAPTSGNKTDTPLIGGNNNRLLKAPATTSKTTEKVKPTIIPNSKPIQSIPEAKPFITPQKPTQAPTIPKTIETTPTAKKTGVIEPKYIKPETYEEGLRKIGMSEEEIKKQMLLDKELGGFDFSKKEFIDDYISNKLGKNFRYNQDLAGKYSEEIENIYKEAIKKYKPKPSIISPVKSKVSTEIPEGYFKNAFGEIVKNPNSKKAGTLNIGQIGKDLGLIKKDPILEDKKFISQFKDYDSVENPKSGFSERTNQLNSRIMGISKAGDKENLLSSLDKGSLRRVLQDNPSLGGQIPKQVTIYRVGDGSIKPGDMVAIEKSISKTLQDDRGYGKLVNQTVSPDEIVIASDSQEFFYVPKELQKDLGNFDSILNNIKSYYSKPSTPKPKVIEGIGKKK